MKPSSQRKVPRYPRASLSVFTLNHVYPRSPFLVLWWSAAIPGFGHMMLGKYLQGFLLVGWEFYTNVQAHLNEAIFLTMIGDFVQAKAVLETKWISLYIAVYVFTIWDSYNKTNDANKLAMLSENEWIDQPPVVMTPVGIHFMRPYKPWLALLWSSFLPGLGHIYLQRLISGLFAFAGWILTCYFSRLPTGLHYTMTGHFAEAIATMPPQWVLFMPSLYGYALFETHMAASQFTKLFKQQQGYFLKEQYQDKRFRMPI
ncbi:hypothetical protein [Paenibacillus hamazuiensis]|uniref:hypothetical protein n=1 Tax=Paenibacillus hamazuiensis TaxID=2936508 RepID=UPI00200C7D10|nr:hypothetical protein [Paenibacillus hamazuiensis]